MPDIDSWRGVDLAGRRRKIENAIRIGPVTSAEDMPLIVNTPCYFAFGTRDKPADYFTNPRSMVRYQEEGWARHLTRVRDDAVPYVMPWYGTGVLASAFGADVRFPDRPGEDPSVAGPCIDSPARIAALRPPETERDGLMPRVLETIAVARETSDLPVGLTDMNSPLSTAAQLCGYDKLFYWMYDDPRAVHALLDLVTDAFIAWVKAQKARIGEPLDASNGLQGTWSPRGVGVWASDDDLVTLGPDLYREFVLPRMERLYAAFGGGSLHFCGDGSHQAENILAMTGVRVVNNSPMGRFAAFAKLAGAIQGKKAIQIQDSSPVDPDAYYDKLFSVLDDLRGVMLVSFTLDTQGIDVDGAYRPVTWDPPAAADRVVRAIRAVLGRRMTR
jgi:uroporphyrinogen-III decarboxylase